MKERPILFSSPMVRAIIAGTKTQTRRAIKPQPLRAHDPDIEHYSLQEFSDNPDTLFDHRHVLCPYGQPGDRLYVRETWRTYDVLDRLPPRGITAGAGVQYEAGGTNLRSAPDRLHGMGKTRTAIHMPRWASRIDLEVTGVRVERLNDISEADAEAEGVESLDSEAPEERTHHDFDLALCSNCGGLRLYMGGGLNGVTFDMDCMQCDTHAKRFRHLWESINGAGSWVENPFVWVIEFKRVKP